MTSQAFGKELEHLARPLVEAGVYASQEAFVRDIVKDMATKRMRTYEGVVRRYTGQTRKLGTLRHQIKGKASPKQEDDWMEWEAAEGMLRAWKKVAESSV